MVDDKVVRNNNPTDSLGMRRDKMHKTNLFSSFGGTVSGDKAKVDNNDFARKDKLLDLL